MYKLLSLLLLLLASCGSVYIEDIAGSIEPAPIMGYEIGDVGPAGGWIFYKNPVQEAGLWKYLELSNIDYEFSNVSWDNRVAPDFVGTSTEIGAGESNTQKIFKTLTVTNDFLYAALTCIDLNVDYEGESFSDWFLPSLGELGLVFTNLFLTELADLSDKTSYYSSSEFNGSLNNFVWVMRLNSQYENAISAQNLVLKKTSNSVLLIRCARFVY